MSKLIKRNLIIIGIFILLIVIITGCNERVVSESNTPNTLETKSLNLETKNLNSSKPTLDQNIFWIKGSGIVPQPQGMIEINIAIEQRDKDIINASNIVNTNVEKIINIAKSLGISEDDIETKEFSISPVERWIQKED